MSDFNFFLNRQGPKGAQGVKGDTGFSPTIAPSADNDGLTTYKLVITNKNNTYETDNLMGNLDITDDGGTYLRYNREAGSVSASEADTATASAAGVVRLADSTDYTNLADDAVITPSSFVDNYNSIFSAGSGIGIYQNLVDDKIVIGIDDSTVVTETDLASALANYVTSSNLSSTLASYVTSSDLSSTLANYVTNTSLSTTLSSYATQSWVENKNYVINLSNKASSLAIGSGASVGDVNSVAIGYGSRTNLGSSIAIGPNAVTSWGTSIQIGEGTNTSSQTLSIGFGALGNYTLLNGNTGLIPDDRLSSNIARTSDIPDVSNFVTNSSLTTTLSDYALLTDIPSIATSVSSSSTNAETVGAKLFYDTCGDIETLINSL